LLNQDSDLETPKTSDGKQGSVFQSLNNYNRYIFLKTNLAVVSLVVVVIALTQVFGKPVLHRNWSVYVTIIFFCWATFYVLISYIHFKSLYLLSNVYVLMLCLFHLGITVPHAFGADWSSEVVYGFLRDFSGWSAGPLAPWFERSGWYTLVALGSFGIGFALSLKNEKRGQGIADIDETRWSRIRSKVAWDAVGLLIASAIFLLLALKSFGNILAYSRADFFRGAADVRGWGVFLMVFPSAVVLLTIGSKKGRQRILAFGFAALAFGAIVLTGYRSAALFPFLVGVILWVKIGRKIPVVVAIICVALVVIIIPVIGVLRTEKYQDIGGETISQAAEESKILDGFRTMGQTAGVLAHVFRLVPAYEPYRYGTTYLKALIGSLPNILPRMAESERTATKRKAFFKPEAVSELRPADWLTYRINRDRFLRGEGVGFSAIGEPYLNFGPLGVIGFFLLLGWGLGRLDGIDLRFHPNLIIAVGALYWPLVKTVRNDINNFIKPAVFTVICLVIWRLGTKLLAGFGVKQ